MRKILDVNNLMECCTICPRLCRVDRTAGERGICGAGMRVEVYSACLHFGEEPPISGTNGSGTIFFNHCSLRCVYCQNYRFSQLDGGKEFELNGLTDLMFSLEKKGAHNINLVTPTHYAGHIGNSIIRAREQGLKIPIVYNSSGYEKIDTLRLLDGLVDIYLVDMRYGDDDSSCKYSSCSDYVEVNRKAVLEMQRQVGNLKFLNSGIAKRGIIIRHLILPNEISGTDNIFGFISDYLGSDTYISLMSQYYPANKAKEYHELSRGINKVEYNKASSLLYKYNLKNGWVQEYMEDRVDRCFAGTDIEPNV